MEYEYEGFTMEIRSCSFFQGTVGFVEKDYAASESANVLQLDWMYYNLVFN